MHVVDSYVVIEQWRQADFLGRRRISQEVAQAVERRKSLVNDFNRLGSTVKQRRHRE